MPVVLRLEGFKFFFYSNEGDPQEPAHIHVRKAGEEAKFWLTPQVRLARNDGFNAPSLRRISVLINNYHEFLEKSWHEHFTQDS